MDRCVTRLLLYHNVHVATYKLCRSRIDTLISLLIMYAVSSFLASIVLCSAICSFVSVEAS